jgi:ADP-ribose pyrophosphatase YjhB (NUDIX family)
MVAAQANNLRAPGVGVAVVVWEDHSRRRLLAGLGHNAGDKERVYAVPGGHWESGESLVDAVRRETLEEAGISIDHLELISVYDFYNPEKHKSYVTIGFQAVLAAGVPEVMEPENKSNWDWYTTDEALELPFFPPDKVLIERADSGIVYKAG